VPGDLDDAGRGRIRHSFYLVSNCRISLFRVAHHGGEWRLFSKAAATIGVCFFALWLIATAALAISLFSEATTLPRI
jgi:hypothetical protein